MEASKPKWVNPVLNFNGANSLRLAGLLIIGTIIYKPIDLKCRKIDCPTKSFWFGYDYQLLFAVIIIIIISYFFIKCFFMSCAFIDFFFLSFNDRWRHAFWLWMVQKLNCWVLVLIDTTSLYTLVIPAACEVNNVKLTLI